jgi:hypothetical protein
MLDAEEARLRALECTTADDLLVVVAIKRQLGVARNWHGTKEAGTASGPRSTPKSSVHTVYLDLDLTLRPRRERPRGCGVADERDEFPPPHSCFPPEPQKISTVRHGSVVRENSSGFRRLTLRNLNPFVVNVVP